MLAKSWEMLAAKISDFGGKVSFQSPRAKKIHLGAIWLKVCCFLFKDVQDHVYETTRAIRHPLFGRSFPNCSFGGVSWTKWAWISNTSLDWFKGKSTGNMVFTIKYRAFCKFSHNPVLWTPCSNRFPVSFWRSGEFPARFGQNTSRPGFRIEISDFGFSGNIVRYIYIYIFFNYSYRYIYVTLYIKLYIYMYIIISIYNYLYIHSYLSIYIVHLYVYIYMSLCSWGCQVVNSSSTDLALLGPTWLSAGDITGA